VSSYSIKDLERISGIKAHTIRIWEQRYNIINPNRSDTNIRNYNDEDLKWLLNIGILNNCGYKISKIAQMPKEEILASVLKVTETNFDTNVQIDNLIIAMTELDEDRFEKFLSSNILRKGFERTFLEIVQPFMVKVGVLWITNSINPAQEHLVSNIIRQKLIVGTEAVNPLFHLKKSGLLFLPEGEYHELGLLFVQYLLKSRGIKVFYLGANVPLEDVEYVVKYKQPDFIYTHLTSVSSVFNFEKFIQQSLKRFNATPLIISGRLAATYEKKIPSQIHFKRSLQEVTEFITELV
jgi:DNA-binding transcriptional MerR regulator